MKYQGIPTCNCCCTVKKLAKTPSIVALPTNIMRSQKLSWRGGQRYFVRTRWRTTSVIVEVEDAILGGGRELALVLGFCFYVGYLCEGRGCWYVVGLSLFVVLEKMFELCFRLRILYVVVPAGQLPSFPFPAFPSFSSWSPSPRVASNLSSHYLSLPQYLLTLYPSPSLNLTIPRQTHGKQSHSSTSLLASFFFTVPSQRWLSPHFASLSHVANRNPTPISYRTVARRAVPSLFSVCGFPCRVARRLEFSRWKTGDGVTSELRKQTRCDCLLVSRKVR